ncbi:MAG: sodium/solute symporter [Phycisphaerae bacterium]|nr:sodium/solute symporter [Phycisphaerae bacterium]
MVDTCLLAADNVFEGSSLAGIDYVIVLVYMLGVLVIGSYFGRYVKSTGDFFLAGKALPFWAIGMSIVVSDIGAIDFVSGAGGAYRYGIAQANFDWIGSLPAAAIAALVFIPYYWRAGVYTIPEFLGRRYNSAVQIIEAILWLGFLISMLGVMLWATAVMMKTVLGWSVYRSIWTTVIVVGIYTVSGGLAAVVMTDVIQMVIMFIGAGALLVLSFAKAGGWAGVIHKVQGLGPEFQKHFTLLLPHGDPTPYPWTGIVFGLGIVLSTAYFVGNQAVVQRALGARSEWDAKAGMLFAGFLKLFIPVLVIIPGLAALAAYPGLENPDEAVPMLIRDVLPAGLKGLMFAAFFAALMSSVDSYLNSCSTVFMSDVYGKIYEHVKGEPLPPHHGLVLGRVLTAILIIAAGLFAPVTEKFPTIYVAIQTLLSYIQGPTLAILLLGILWRRTTQWGGLAGLVLGVCMTMSLTVMGAEIFPSDEPFLFVSFWSFVFSMVVTVVVSLLTPREPEEKIRSLVFSQVLHDEEVQSALQDRVNGS